MGDLNIVVRELNQVIRLIESVLAFVGANRRIDNLQCVRQERLHFRQGNGLLLAAYLFINARTIVLSGLTDCVDKTEG